MRSGYLLVDGFDSAINHLLFWCDAIMREEQAFDPWAARDELDQLIEGSEDDGDDGLYSVEEQQSLANMLRAIEANVERRLDETGQEVAELKLYIARQFDYLRDDLSTKGRQTWRTMFRDFMVNIAATLTTRLGPGLMHDLVVIANEGMRAIPS